jgi:hypothetical protein
MGLIEKRLIKLGKEEWVPEANKELQELTGGAHVYDVDWETFATDEAALNNLQNQGLRRITAAIRVVARDDLGKESLRETFKRIAVKNSADIKARGVTVKEDALVITCAYGKGSEGYYSDNELIRLIEPQLK